MRGRGLAGEIVGHARSEATRAKALELGFIDRATETAAEAADGADLVVICVPVGASGAVAEAIAPALRPGAIVTDVGSVKQAVIDAVRPHMPEGVHFVPAHPVAGTEQSGPESGFAELFEGRWCILTHPEGTDAGAVRRIEALWRAVGSQVDSMDARHHDMVLAITSHLPHLIAYTIVGTATDLETHLQQEVIKFAAGGFRDFTRIAASDPVMWRDVFLANRDAVLEMLGRFDEDLTALQRAIRYGDGKTLEEIFTRTRAIRRSILEAGQG
jgi:cyclohexadieny/prephenate dehydrogenase